MPKKILICEDNEKIAELLSESFKSRGYISLILAKNKQPSYVVDNIEETVKREDPDFIIVDSLNGKWIEVSESAKKVKPDIILAIFSGEIGITENAKERGYAAFNKPEESSSLFEFIKKS